MAKVRKTEIKVNQFDPGEHLAIHRSPSYTFPDGTELWLKPNEDDYLVSSPLFHEGRQCTKDGQYFRAALLLAQSVSRHVLMRHICRLFFNVRTLKHVNMLNWRERMIHDDTVVQDCIAMSNRYPDPLYALKFFVTVYFLFLAEHNKPTAKVGHEIKLAAFFKVLIKGQDPDDTACCYDGVPAEVMSDTATEAKMWYWAHTAMD